MKLALPFLVLALIASGCGTTSNPPSQVRLSTEPPENVQTEGAQSKTQTQISEEEAKSNCDPNYSGCVPIASDVDCAGGGGNGPAYVRGPVSVIGTDIYALDRDGDGIACEK